MLDTTTVLIAMTCISTVGIAACQMALNTQTLNAKQDAIVKIALNGLIAVGISLCVVTLIELDNQSDIHTEQKTEETKRS